MTALPELRDYSRGREFRVRHDLLRHVLSLGPEGYALEFGVGHGTSLGIIAEKMPVVGFDSFQGLPEDWRPGYPKGSFRAQPPGILHSRLVVGLFADTLPTFDFETVDPIGLVHIDCDLYSSTKTALEWVGPHLRRGCYIVFDEFHGYTGCEDHEQRAWREFAAATNIDWTVIGSSDEPWAIQITKAPQWLN